MTLESYQTWLAERGLSSPGSQPFELFASEIHTSCRNFVLATSTAESADSSVLAVSRLASALGTNGVVTSWVVANEVSSKPSLELIRTLCPTLDRVVELSGDYPIVDGAGFPTESRNVSSHAVHIIFGPQMASMNQDVGLKKSFWSRLQQWVSETHD